LIGIVGGGVQLGQLGTASTNRPIVLSPVDYDDGEFGEMSGRGNRSTRRQPAPVSLCPPQTPTCCPDANPGRCGGKPATNRFSYGTDFLASYVDINPFTNVCVMRIAQEKPDRLQNFGPIPQRRSNYSTTACCDSNRL
jgi:hypothetical protein